KVLRTASVVTPVHEPATTFGILKNAVERGGVFTRIFARSVSSKHERQVPFLARPTSRRPPSTRTAPRPGRVDHLIARTAKRQRMRRSPAQTDSRRYQWTKAPHGHHSPAWWRFMLFLVVAEGLHHESIGRMAVEQLRLAQA